MKLFGIRKIIALLALSTIALGQNAVQPAQATDQQQEEPPTPPLVSYPVYYDLSPALDSLPVDELLETQEEGGELRPFFTLPKAAVSADDDTGFSDAALQSITAANTMPATGFNFDGVNNLGSVIPPDTNGDIGPNHYVQWVNLWMAIWQLDRQNHTATKIYGPTAGNAIWSGFGGPCATRNDGDPIVLYDHLADRWFISQFALPSLSNGPYYQCIAVSQTGNPTGAWYRYAYIVSNTKMNDYPHFGVWPDGYYMSVNQFIGGAEWGGAGVAVFERDKMLLGLPARMVYFDVANGNINFGGMLPADLDGPAPPTGTPNYFAEVDDTSWVGTFDAMRIWEFHADWNIPAQSTFGLNLQPNAILAVTPFAPRTTRVPQPSPGIELDTIGDRIMHRLQYRYFDTYATLVTNHTVSTGGRAAVRWYEARRTGSAWNISQQGTYAGDGSNAEHRWMGSAAMDRVGNIAVGYSISSVGLFPSIAYTGRLVSDPPNTLPQGEAFLMAGGGAQTSPTHRWGDYSMLGIDPTDDCTFWYTNEYYAGTFNNRWNTRIGSFVFPSCLGSLSGALQGSVTVGGSPLAGATVSAGAYSTQTAANGTYSFPDLPVGVYTVIASAYGYQPVSVPGVQVNQNTTTLQNFSLTLLPRVPVHGTVIDGSGQGWPLYARIEITAPGYNQAIYTNPVSGAYSISLPVGTPHTFSINAVTPGYLTHAAEVTPTAPDTTRNFALSVDGAACTALGYTNSGGCSPGAGGLMVGQVTDLNTGVTLNSALVASNDNPLYNALTFATPADLALGDGQYILYFPLTGSRGFTASMGGYGSLSQNATIIDGGVASRSFSLPAGILEVSPARLTAKLSSPQVIQMTLEVRNSGTFPVSFSVSEVDGLLQQLTPTGPFAEPTRNTSPKRLDDLTAAAVYVYNPPVTLQLDGGEVLQQWNTGLAHPWGIEVDGESGSVWVGDVSIGGGDDSLHSFSPDGASLGESISTASLGAHFAADLTYHPFDRTFWQISVDSDNCLVEISPLHAALTGARICPAFDHAQRGIAYDPLTRTFYSGSWTNGILYHFNESGVILDSVQLGLNIAGLAFNSDTRHLFVLSNANTGFEVYMLGIGPGYPVLGGFNIPGLDDFQQAGMSMDCDGNLWIANQASGQVIQAGSGEQSACTYADATWLSVSPIGGFVQPGNSQTLTVTIDGNLAPSAHEHASLEFSNDAPYGAPSVPVELLIGKFNYIQYFVK